MLYLKLLKDFVYSNFKQHYVIENLSILYELKTEFHFYKKNLVLQINYIVLYFCDLIYFGTDQIIIIINILKKTYTE